MRIGEAVHCKMLEPDTYASRFVESPFSDGRTKEFKVFALENAGKTILKPDHTLTIDTVCKALGENILGDPDYSALFTGIKEHSFYWVDKETGVLCKCRPDIIAPNAGIITDLKVVEDASFKAFENTLAKQLYFLQAAYYLDGVNACLEQSGNSWFTAPDSFVFVAVERELPNGIGKYSLEEGSAALKEGRRLYKKALELYAHCVRSNEWKGYSRQILPLDLPNWALYAHE